MGRLNGKIALVTGAAQGIGFAIGELFQKEGALVIATDIQFQNSNLESVSHQNGPIQLGLDVSSESDWVKARDLILTKFNRIDILINNAGITGMKGNFGPLDPEHSSLESWRHIHSVNLDGVFLGCKYGIELMKGNGGSIVNISSRSGMVGIPASAAYASSKAAVRNHTKTVALYCASKDYEIRCNSIHPAAILTPMWDEMLGQGAERSKAIQAVSAEIPLKKMGSPMDVAFAALYLASDESKYLTGSELVVDGGVLAGAAAAPKRRT